MSTLDRDPSDRHSGIRRIPGPDALAPAGNRLLAMLSPDDRALLRPTVEPLSLEVRQVLHRAGETIDHAYFVESGLVSIVGANKRNRRIEIGMVGYEGLTGVELVLGADRGCNEALVQSAGSALRISRAGLRDAMAASRSLTSTLLLFVHAFMVQGCHTAIAGGRGKIDERLARGLLMWHDRIRQDEFFTTHEFLALLLGVRRQGVTVALHVLEGKRLIRSRRNLLQILDREGLKRAANGFYGTAEEEYDRLLGAAAPIDRAA
jgi:CRP-like cAMP-binding protein